ncbi:MAG: BACON domain-containing carbohydrate-binding protein [Bryobacteraceae bacterium]
MRILPYVAAALIFSQAGFAQNYTISTVAGGGFPDAIQATSASLGEVDGVAVDGNGNVYIANPTYAVVTMVDGSGNLSRIAGNGKAGFSGDNGPAVGAQLNNPRGVAVSSSGDIYIADTLNHRVRKISNGTITTVAGNGVAGYSGDGGPATSAQLNFPWGVAVDSSENLYIADTSNHVIRKVSGGTITTFAGTGSQGAGQNNVSPTSGGLNQPRGVAVDSSGAVYLTDTGNNVIRKVSGGVMTVLAGQGFGGVSTLNSPFGVAVDSSGNIYFSDTGDHVVGKISGSSATLFAGSGTAGFSGDGGVATSAAMNSPSGMAVDSQGRVLLADSQNGRIRRVSGGNISTVAGLGSGGYVGDGGPALSSLLFAPASVAADGAGTIFIADANNARVRQVTNGNITTIAGNGVVGDAGDGGAATNANFAFPTGVAVDGGGNIYVADFDASRIRKVSGGVITTFAGNGTAGISTDGTTATSAPLAFTPHVALDGSGNVYFSENGGFVSGVRVASRVRKVSGGTISTVAGVAGNAGFGGDGGAGNAAQVNGPYGVAVDANGNVYIADTYNNRIRLVSNGNISTFAGNGAQGFAGDGGLATGAQLNQPQGVAVDAAGSVYIADTGNNRIRLVSNGTITTIGGTGTAGYTGDGGAATNATLNGPQGIFVDSYGRVLVADASNNAIRALSLPCSYTVTQALAATSAGGPLALAIQTTPICSWSVSGLPTWITIPGASSGTGNGTVNLQVAANTGVARSAIISVASTQLTVNQAAGCIYVLSSAGQAFPAAGSSVSVAVTVNPGCPWTAGGAPSWVNVTSGASGSGNGTVNLTAAANAGSARTATMTIAGKTFTVEQSYGTIAGLTLGGSLAQVASQGTWKFTLNAINLGDGGALTRFSFLDDNGAGLALPLTFPQQSSTNGPLTAAVLDRTIDANAQLVIESTGPDSAPQLIGSGLLQSNGNVSGFGIFSNPTLGWNAVVPLESRNAPNYILAFDNTNGLATGLAIANLSSSAATVPVIIRDDTGAVIGTTTINLPVQGHTSFMLNAQYSVTVNKRGTIEFDTPGFGTGNAQRISVLGLRAIGGALTTLPVLANVGTGGGSIAHATYNGGFTSVFYIVNTGAAAADFTLSFLDESGSALQVPLLLPQTGTNVTTSGLTRNLAPGAMLVVQTVANDAASPIAGSAQLTSTGNVSGFEIFRWTTFGQEASVPLETRSPNSYVLVFDDTNATTTGVAIANGGAAAINVTVNIRNDAGVLLKTVLLNLPAKGHKSFLLPDFDAVTGNVRGMAEFVVPQGGKISVIGLRARADGTLTTIPVLTK